MKTSCEVKMGNHVLRRILSSLLVALVGAAPAFAGGALETLDITGFVPSPIAGQVVAKVIGFRWDSRCMPVQYRVNNFAATVPNPLGASLTVCVFDVPVGTAPWPRASGRRGGRRAIVIARFG